MKNVKTLVILGMTLVIAMVSCSKNNDAHPSEANAKLILGTWYETESYSLNNGDTTEIYQYPRSDDNKIVFQEDGVASQGNGNNNLPTQAYYKVADKIIYLSDDPLPSTLSTSVIDGIDIWAEFIVKLDSKTLIVQNVSDEGSLTDDYSILKR